MMNKPFRVPSQKVTVVSKDMGIYPHRKHFPQLRISFSPNGIPEGFNVLGNGSVGAKGRGTTQLSLGAPCA